MKKDDGDGCAYIIGIALLGAGVYLVSRIIAFFKQPDALDEIAEFMQGVGLCIGAVIAFVLVAVLAGSLSRSMEKRLRRESRLFASQALARLMLPDAPGPYAPTLPEAPDQASSRPTAVRLAMTNYGLWVTASTPGAKERRPHPPDEADAPKSFLAELGSSIVIPTDSADVCYLVCHRGGVWKSETELDRTSAFRDGNPHVPEGDSLRIVIVFDRFFRNSLREAVRLEQPRKLEMVVQDQDGHEDPPATIELYRLLYDSQRKSEAYDDDSWMYRSRPMRW